MVFAVLINVSTAYADDDDDDDDRRSYRYSEWQHHHHHHGKRHKHHRHGHGHRHWHCDDDDCEYDDDDDDDDKYAHRHKKGHKHWHHSRHKKRRSSDWIYLEEEETVEIVPTGPIIWHNPDSGRSANPPAPRQQSHRAPENSDGYASGPCREYHTTARVGGRIQHIYGQACRQPDGSWKFVR